MEIKEKIWHEFIDKKFGDEYLCKYISNQTTIRKWFKIGTILLSAGGIWSAFQKLTIPTVISLFGIAIAQLATLIENFIILSEKQLEDLGKLRLLYYEQWNNLEKLFLTIDDMSQPEATSKFFELRNLGKSMEELDNKLNIKRRKKIQEYAEVETRNYIKTHYNV